MPKIGRSFDELDNKIKTVNQSIKETDSSVKSLDKNLKLNPGNVDAIRQKYTLLNSNVKNTAERLELLKQKQQALNNDFNNGTITQDTYNRQLAKTATQIDKTEKELEALNKQLERQNADIRQAKFNNLTSGLTKVEGVAKKASVAVLAVGAAIVAMVKSSITTGDELSDLATKYQTTAENIQIWRNRLTLLASDENAYVSSLATVGSMLTSITAGRGARYLKYLNELGIAQEDLTNKTNAEVFELIYQGLRNVSDETERAIIAQGLLGDTGLEIATIARTDLEELTAYDEELIRNGIISSEQAAIADGAANKLAQLKMQFQANSAELMTALMPAFEALINLFNTTLLPIISNIASRFASLNSEQQKSALRLIALIILLPKLVAMIKGIVSIMNLLTAAKTANTVATHAQTAATAALNTVMTPWLGIITAISMALLVLCQILSIFTGRANEAINVGSQLTDTVDGLDTKMEEMGYDVEAEANSTYDVNRTATIDVNVTATGDGTKISDDNAEVVAKELEEVIITDLVNQGLGSIIK